MHTHSPNKLKKFKQTSACQTADGNCFLGQKRCADSGIHATWDHNNTRSVFGTLKKKKNCVRPANLNERQRILTFGVVLLHDKAHPLTAAHTRTLLEHFNWDLFDHPP
jgi:hypothetical protein